MIQRLLFFYVLSVVGCVVSAVGQSSLHSTAKGFFPKRSSPHVSFENAVCIEFVLAKVHGLTVTYSTPANHGMVPARRDYVGPLFYYFDPESQNLITKADVDELRQRKVIGPDYIKKFPTAKPLIEKEFQRIDALVTRFNQGERLFNGTWMTESALAGRLVQKGWSGVASLVVRGQKYSNAVSAKQEGEMVTLKHSGGIAKMSVSLLSDQQVADLNANSSGVIIKKFSIALLDAEARDRLGVLNDEIRSLTEEVDAEKDRIIKEAKKALENLATDAEAIKLRIAKDCNERIKLAGKDIDNIEKQIKNRQTSSKPEFLNFAEALNNAGRLVSFEVMSPLDKSKFKTAKQLPGDSLYLIELPGKVIGMISSVSSLVGQEGLQEQFIRQVMVEEYKSKSGFVKSVPVFVYSDPVDVTRLADIQRRLANVEIQIESLHTNMNHKVQEVDRLRQAIAKPAKTGAYAEFFAKLDEKEAFLEESEAKQRALDDPKKSSLALRIARLKEEAGKVTEKHEAEKTALLRFKR